MATSPASVLPCPHGVMWRRPHLRLVVPVAFPWLQGETREAHAPAIPRGESAAKNISLTCP